MQPWKQILKGFQTGKRWRKSSLMTEFRQKLKIFAQILGRQWKVVKRVVVGVLCLHFIVYANVYGEAVQQLIVFRILLIHRMILRKSQEKVKTFLKNRRSKKLSKRMGAESQMVQFAKEDLNLKRRLLEQLEKSDADFNQNIAKVGRTMDTISNVIQQCVGKLGNLAKGSQHYGQFHPNFFQHDPLLHLQNQDFFNNGLNHNEQYREKGGEGGGRGGINKT